MGLASPAQAPQVPTGPQCELFRARVSTNGLFGAWVTDMRARNAWVACLGCGCWVVRASSRQVIIWGVGGLLRVRVARSRCWWSFGAPVACPGYGQPFVVWVALFGAPVACPGHGEPFVAWVACLEHQWPIRGAGALFGVPVACPGHGEPFTAWAAFLECLWPIQGVHRLFGAPVACPGHGEPFMVGAAFLRHLWPIQGVRRLLGAPEACPGCEQPFGVWGPFWSASELFAEWVTFLERQWSMGSCSWHGQPFWSACGPFEVFVICSGCQRPVQGVSSPSGCGEPFWSASEPFAVWVTFLECQWSMGSRSRCGQPFWSACGPFEVLVVCLGCQWPVQDMGSHSQHGWPFWSANGPFKMLVVCSGRKRPVQGRPVQGMSSRSGHEEPFSAWVTFLECEWSVGGIGGLIGVPVACPGHERPFWSATAFGGWEDVSSGRVVGVVHRDLFAGTVTRAVSTCRWLSAPVEGLSAPVSSARFCEA
ncbi:hypothetical protein BU15DRAFT_65631 [Melanogaster broomeanus]|nr:hypothetical protein BU15DRAFT_65631 [Melanogaster broomeanus]